ncbi:Uncharacterised protein [Mycobacteroides abscessus]|nr:hypothetical protein [Mycobacteroides abscessus]CPU47297.1 Uncharacterised protein [Mycobacteroides abscessus]CPX16140.1 Uncharacterised protein [Mycobacteroides abscessus]CQA10646.1 Uncharacterised protein [Mycobacteroides abscessus]SHR44370.1 Uncharacterised protein [Mycobacteroides abscessus subsp. abscessus]SKG68918.1 Uncharacterised protein [Mycobacteroides abscessus subsp. massiliense]
MSSARLGAKAGRAGAAHAGEIAFSAIEEVQDTVLYAIYARNYAKEIA